MAYSDLSSATYKKVDFHCETNNSSHHTSDIRVDQLIVRRGQSFVLTVDLLRPYNPDANRLRFTVDTGPKASKELGTQAVFGIQGLTGFHREGDKAIWKAELHEGSALHRGRVILDVTPPADAPIGEYELSVTSEGPKVFMGKLVVLFNPWCKDDLVHLPEKAERQEYVMNEHGIIYGGTHSHIEAKDWAYGQFEEDMVDICLKLLDVNPKFEKDSADDTAARCNPIYVSRVVSAMINCNDDRGVLAGSWGDYSGGDLPSSWSGSVKILQKWHKSDCQAVKYGQCFVFAGVMCTVLRCLGIPCRVVTNFKSAHDMDGSLTIDVFSGDYGVQLPKKESIWEFHVWVEAWMRRPDLKEDGSYDGWQVLDATPQERSNGVFCLGPAPVAAVRAGHTDQKYDVPFVFAEVNADVTDWLVMADGSKRIISSDTKRVGQNISTKSVGSNKRMDITDSYKHREGTDEERSVFKHALARVGRPTNGTNGVHAPKVISMNIEEVSRSINGQDISLKLQMSNKGQAARRFSVNISTQIMRHTGVPSANVCTQRNDVTLQPGRDMSVPILVRASAYRGHMLNGDSVKVSAMATDKEQPDAIYLTEADITLESPHISITVPEVGQQDRELSVEVVCKNPLDEELRNCFLTVTGSGLVKDDIEARLPEVGPHRQASFKFTIRPYKQGVKTLLVDFDCSSFRHIKGSCTIRILPDTLLGSMSSTTVHTHTHTVVEDIRLLPLSRPPSTTHTL